MQETFHTATQAILTHLAKEQTTARSLLEAVLEHINQVNPQIGALTSVIAAQARADAARIDSQRQAGENPGPLAGLPVLVKDIIDTTPAACPAGLPFFANYRPQSDAEIVQRLRQAGAVVVGVTATDPGAFGVRTDATRHPQAPDRSVGGSSGGSAAALAAGFGWAALGTDTGGSVRIPAACCMTASLKPTLGRLPGQGVRPLSWTLDHVGPMARRVADIAVVQACLDPLFGATRSALVPEKARIGVDMEFFSEADAVVREGVQQALDACRRMGCEIVPVRLPTPDDTANTHGLILMADAAAYYEQAGLADHPDMPELPRYCIDWARGHSAIQYAEAARQRRDMRAQVNLQFDNPHVDFLLLPTLPVLTPLRSDESVTIAGREFDYTTGLIRYTHLFNHTGHPVVAMPASVLGRGLGVGIQIVARHHRDADALAFAGRLEAELALSIDWQLAV